MSDAVSEWLDAAEADAHRKVTLGQPVARELDRLLANDRANLVRALAALRAIFEQIIDPGPTDEYDTGFEEGERQGYHDALSDVRQLVADALEVTP